MSVSGIHGNILEVTVVACNKLKDTEWISRQDPYVCLEYSTSKFRSRTCTDGGKQPIFQEKFNFILIEGLRELNVVVWNSNTLTFDDFIGTGKIQLAKVLAEGFDDSTWPLQSKTGRYAGEIRVIMHYPNAKNKLGASVAQCAPAYGAPPIGCMYSTPPSGPQHPYPPLGIACPGQSNHNSYPHNMAHYPPPPPNIAPYQQPNTPNSPFPMPPYPSPSHSSHYPLPPPGPYHGSTYPQPPPYPPPY